MIVTMSFAGGSSWAPGKKYKYVSIVSYIGYTITFFGAIVTHWSEYNKPFIGTTFIILKIISAVIALSGYLATVILTDKVMPMRSFEYSMMILLIVIWALFEIYFIFVLIAYSNQKEVETREFAVVPIQYPVFIMGRQAIPQGVPVSGQPEMIQMPHRMGTMLRPAYPPQYPPTYPPPYQMNPRPASMQLGPASSLSNGADVLPPDEKLARKMQQFQ